MEQTISDWSLLETDWTANQFDSYQYPPLPYTQYGETPPGPLPEQPPPEAQHHITSPHQPVPLLLTTDFSAPAVLRHDLVPFPRGDNPREIRNKAEKQRRDKLNQSIAELAAMVPPVVAASRKIDKTGVLRLTAHYLRAHQYVFGDTIGTSEQDFSSSSAQAILGFLHGFLLTTTYRGIIVVVSQNVSKYLGYSELDLLGQNLLNITHEEDRQLLKEHLMPQSHLLGPNGELLVPDEPDGAHKVSEALARDKRRFVIRFKKLAKRSEPVQYLSCHVEGCLRKSDKACRGYTRCCQMVRRARARGDNPCSSGNDVVFVGIVRPTTETFQTESNMEEYHMEYRTRHSVDGEIIECEQRIALVTGYMTHEVHGVNAMNFMHRDDVRWVIIALREMYDSHRLVGESCYRLMTKSGHFIYMRTRGQLDVDENTRAVTSFACTNTVVDEREGKELIKLMKKKFTMLVNNNDDLPENADTDDSDDGNDCDDGKAPPVEDPRQLEKVILHLVTNLPSPQADDDPRSDTPDRGESPSKRLSIIPPKKERIVSAIDNIYKVLKKIDPKPENDSDKLKESSNEFLPSTSQAEYCELLPAKMTPSTSGIDLRRGINFPSSSSQTGLYALHSPLSSTIDRAESVAQLPASSIEGTQNAAPEESTSSHKSMYLAVPTSTIVQADRHAARRPPASSFRATQDALAVPQPSTSSHKAVYIAVPQSAIGQTDRQAILQPPTASFRGTRDALLSSTIVQAERRPVPLPSASQKAMCHTVPTSTTVAERRALLPTSSYTLERPTVLLAATGETATGRNTNQQELVTTRTQLVIQHPDFIGTPNQGSSILSGYNRSSPSTSSMRNMSKSTQSDNVPPHVIKCLLLAPRYNIRYLPLPSTSQQVDRAQPGPSGGETSSLKRGNDCKEQEVGTKKKICEPVERTEQSDRLESFLDEAMLNTNIEHAVRALEQNQGPVFPELISLEDVEEFLTKIEAAQEND